MMDIRYKELDSLRGIAAISVFLFHIVMILPESWKEGAVWSFLFISPLHIFFTGQQPVILFFVLSGFVLSLIFLTEKKTTYFSYIVKRIMRLYIPYIISIIFAIILCQLFSKGGDERLGNLFNILWIDSINFTNIIDHILFLGNYNVYAFNIVIWTLIHELRISFIFPFLVVIAIRFNWKINMLFGMALAISGAIFHLLFQDPYQPVYKSLFYILMFIVGILISKNRDYITGRYNEFSKKTKFGFTIIGLLLYLYADLFGNPLLIDWVTTLGVAILLTVSLSSKQVSKILLWKPLLFLGKISYSLYLYHLPILLSLLYIFYSKVHLLIIISLSLIITTIISVITWKVIEIPSIKIGKYFSREIKIKEVKPVFNEEKGY